MIRAILRDWSVGFGHYFSTGLAGVHYIKLKVIDIPKHNYNFFSTERRHANKTGV